MIRQLDPLLSFPATDLPRAVRFYTTVLGARPIVEEAALGFYIFQLPAGEGMLGLHHHPGPLPAPDPHGIWCWVWVAVLEEATERLRLAGVTLIGEPSELGPGRQQAFVDSEGNVLRLYEPLDRVERQITIKAPASHVFAALTTASAMERWFSTIDDVVFEPRLGGTVSFRDPTFGPVTGRITEWNQPHQLAIAFGENWPARLEYRLHESSGATTLTVVQTDFAPIRARDVGIPDLILRLDNALGQLSTIIAGAR